MTRPEDVERIPPATAHHRAKHGEAVLVCAYEDEDRCRGMLLEGAITLRELREQLPELASDEQIVLYCASPDEGTAADRARELRESGRDAVVLGGGADAWSEAGLPVHERAGETP